MKCTICKRKTPEEFLEKHHLIPKSRKGKETIPVCHNCGDQLHRLFTNKELEREYNTVKALLDNDKVQKWVKWISKKRSFRVPRSTKKRR